MPTCPWPPVTRIHSWSFVYFSSTGYMSAPRSLVERQRHDARAGRPVADVDGDLGIRRRGRGHVGHANGLLQERRLRATRHLARGHAVNQYRIAVTRDGAIDHLEADEPPGEAPLLLGLER